MFSRDIRRRITAQLLPRNQRSRWLNVVRRGTCRNGGSARPSHNIPPTERSLETPVDRRFCNFYLLAPNSPTHETKHTRRKKRRYSTVYNLFLFPRDYQRRIRWIFSLPFSLLLSLSLSLLYSPFNQCPGSSWDPLNHSESSTIA